MTFFWKKSSFFFKNACSQLVERPAQHIFNKIEMSQIYCQTDACFFLMELRLWKQHNRVRANVFWSRAWSESKNEWKSCHPSAEWVPVWSEGEKGDQTCWSFLCLFSYDPLATVRSLNTSQSLKWRTRIWCFTGGAVVKNSSAKAEDLREAGSIPGSGRCPGEGHGHPTPIFLSGESHGQGAWWALAHRVARVRRN